MRKMKKFLSLALACVVSASMLAGCGSSSSSTGSAPAASEAGSQAAAGTAAAETAVVKVGIPNDITSLDPHNHNDQVSGYATRHIYNCLIKLTDNNEFVGDLAESWEYADDTTINFTLKPDVKFQNGAVLTSEDVKFSLERQKESAKVGHLVSMIDNVEVVDDTHFVIHLSEPSNAVISSLAHMGGAIYCKSYVEELEAAGKTVEEAPMGTGPYTFVEWVPGTSVELAKYDDYFDKDNAAQNAGLLFKVIPEETSRTIALENGEIDILMKVPANDAGRIRDDSNLALDEFASTSEEYFCMNTSKAPFDDVRVRQAINYAIKKDDVLIAAINGEGKTINGYIGEAAIGYYDTAVKYEYDVEKAKALLAEAGVADGFTFTCFSGSDTRSRSATVIQANLAELGITMNIEQMEAATFYEKTGKGEHDACMTGWIANAEPDNTYRPLFTSEKAGPGGNRAFYKNPEVDALVDDAVVNRDKDAVAEDYKKITEIVSGDAIWCPLYSATGMVARNAKLQGLGISAIGMERLEGLHFEG